MVRLELESFDPNASIDVVTRAIPMASSYRGVVTELREIPAR